MADLNYYELLGITHEAEEVVITGAYKALAKKYHPDVYRDKELGEAKLKQINVAYETLSDPDKRRKYDESLKKEYSKNYTSEDKEEPTQKPDKKPREPFLNASAGANFKKLVLKKLLPVIHWLLFAYMSLIFFFYGWIMTKENEFFYQYMFSIFLVVLVCGIVPTLVCRLIYKKWIWFPWQHGKD